MIEKSPSEMYQAHGYTAKLKRGETERFVACQPQSDGGIIIKIEPRDKLLWKYLLCSILVIALSMIALYFGYDIDKNSELQVYNNTVYCFIFLILCNLFIILDYTDLFPLFQIKFELYGLYFLIGFLLIAFIDYLLIGLQEDALIAGLLIIILIETLFYIALFCFFCTFMAYWKSWSFHCSGKAWIHALLYLSIIGYIFIAICRWLHPPPNNNNNNKHKRNNNMTYWHKRHSTHSVLTAVISILSLLFLFCVILGGIGICLFSEFASFTSQFGLEIAFISFIIMSFVIMLTPLAPGSIIDACGGFIFVLLLVPRYTGFFTAWALAVVSIVILHYCGACIQWWMGTWRCIQVWGNTNLPVEMLAASDAVLRTANWFKVGLVGYIFLDTANGLNQGRINMEFWTQLFSEWTAIPNALGLVSFGATIAATAISLEGYDWTLDAVPLLIIFSTVVQAIGFTFGTREMAQSVDSEQYWCSREKWEMMHYFKKIYGYIPTQEGWKYDVFNLGNNEYTVCSQFNDILYDKVEIVHNEYVKNRNKLKDAQQRLNLYKKYLTDLYVIRVNHYEEFSKYIDKAMQQKWLLYEKPTVTKSGFFALQYDEDVVVVDEYNDCNNDKTEIYTDSKNTELSIFKLYLLYLLIIILVITFWASFYGFYWSSDLAATVTGGTDILIAIQWYWWMCLIVFIVVLIFINHIEIITNTKSFCSGLYFICTGCQIDERIETKFETPKRGRYSLELLTNDDDGTDNNYNTNDRNNNNMDNNNNNIDNITKYESSIGLEDNQEIELQRTDS